MPEMRRAHPLLGVRRLALELARKVFSRHLKVGGLDIATAVGLENRYLGRYFARWPPPHSPLAWRCACQTS